MKTWSIRNKLLFAFAIVTLFAVTSGGFAIRGLHTLNTNENVMVEIALSSNTSTQLAKNIQQQNLILQSAAISFYTGSEFQTKLSGLTALNDEFNRLLSLQENSIPPEEEFAVNLITATSKTYTNEYIPALNSLQSALNTGNEPAIHAMLEQLTTPIDTIYSNMDTFATAGMELLKETSAKDEKTASLIITIMCILLGVTVCAAITLAFKSSGKICVRARFMRDLLSKMGRQGIVHLTEDEYRQAKAFNELEQDEIGESIDMLIETGQRLQMVGDLIETVAGGDLTSKIDILSPEDKIGINMKKMLNSLNEIFSSVNTSSMQMASGSRQMADNSQVLSQSSTEQAAAVEELSASVSEITVKTKENADMAANAARLADIIKQSAEKGSVQMDNMMGAVREIGDASQKIGNVIKVIDDIAFQTNILALNAAVEAARAGQHGKGFAVVAEEVRNLAAKSADAAKDTSSLIANSMEKAELGARIANETAASLRDIVSGINETTQLIGDIAHYSDEQAVNISQLNSSIEQVSAVTQQSSSTAEECSAASTEMSNQADILKRLIQQYEIRKDFSINLS